jgi:hypothetical protein
MYTNVFESFLDVVYIYRNALIKYALTSLYVSNFFAYFYHISAEQDEEVNKERFKYIISCPN